MTVGRTLIQPVNINSASLTAPGVLPVTAPTAGIDAAATGGTAFATAWGGTSWGIQFQNNGLCFVYFWCGTTAAGVYQILQGKKTEGQLPPPGTFGGTISATSSGYLPPLPPGDFNQQDATAFNGTGGPGGSVAALGGVVGASGVGLTCVDFTTTTSLSVRLYQLTPVT